MANRTGTMNTDLVIGTEGNDIVRGVGVGLDVVNTLGGDDRVYVQPGGDGVLDLLPDIINMGSGIDTLSLDFHGLANDFTLGRPVLGLLGLAGSLNLDEGLGLTFTGVEHFIVTTGAGDDALAGGSFGDTFVGGAGSDTIDGDAGDDRIAGGVGADVLAGGDGIDALDYGKSHGGVTVSLASGATSGGDATGDSISGFENLFGSAFKDVITGNAGANLLIGDKGNDVLSGGLGLDTLEGGIGNDSLVGGAGVDALSGGLGADRFGFTALSDSGAAIGQRDRITDFSHLQGDRIDLSALDANAGKEGNQSFHFIGSAAFTGAAGEIHTSFVQDSTLVQIDTNGDKMADLAIVLVSHVDLVSADFVL